MTIHVTFITKCALVLYTVGIAKSSLTLLNNRFRRPYHFLFIMILGLYDLLMAMNKGEIKSGWTPRAGVE